MFPPVLRACVSALIFCTAVLLLSACATTRTYPICSWRAPLSETDIAAFRDNTKSLVNTYLDGDDVQVAFSSSNRLMVARGRDHTQLANAWPRIGCIGDYEGPIRFTEYAVCVEYLERAMRETSGVPKLGRTSDYGDPPKQIFCK